MRKCIRCGRSIFDGYFCRHCRKKIPSGYHSDNPAEIMAEIARNEQARSEFQKSYQHGELQIDRERFMFHIDNGYYRIHDLKEYSFYFSEPRLQGIFGHRTAYADVYFSFSIRNQERRVRRISVSACQYETTADNEHYLPPEDMLKTKNLFRKLIEEETVLLKQKYGTE